MPDLAYVTSSYRLANAGLVARYVEDQPPENSYLDLTNLECRQEGALSTRYPISIVTVSTANQQNAPLPPPANGVVTPVISLGRMLGLGGSPFNYAATEGTPGTQAALYLRSGDGLGSYGQIYAGLSGQRMSIVSYRPSFSSIPYAYFCDANAMLKNSGTALGTSQMGINPPTLPAGELISAAPQQRTIAAAASNGLVRAGNIVTCGCTAALGSNFQVGATVVIAGAADSSFNGTFTISALGIAINGVRTSFSYVQVGANATSGSGTATAQGVLTTGSGAPYDWRYTFYNAATGVESGPSTAYLTPNLFSLTSQFATIGRGASADPQVTHWRLYRRGGTLGTAWYQVAQIPISQQSFLDNNSDSSIQNNPVLNIDADPPVTTTLSSPVTTTIQSLSAYNGGMPSGGPGTVTVTVAQGFGATMYAGQLVDVGQQGGGMIEQTRITSIINGSQFTAYLQLPHAVGDPVTVSTRPNTPMRLAAIAFDRLWLAGDPNNPNLLYYSQQYNPETFPVENFIEIGTPSDPIMAAVAHRGLLYVFTQRKVYEVVAINTGVPIAIDLGVAHGLAYSFAWTRVEGLIVYLSQDGVYAFDGGQSQYISEQIEWLFQNRSLGPLLPLSSPGNAVYTSYPAANEPVMAFYENEVFLAYTDTQGNRRRLIYHMIYRRWRPDTVQATAMLPQSDRNQLLIGILDDPGNLYLDRQNGGSDWYGYDGSGKQIFTPVSFRLETPATDNGQKKAFKVYNELTLDADTQGQAVTPALLVNSLQTTVSLGSASSTGRAQSQVNVNSGLGTLSLNAALVVSGSTVGNQPITLYELHLRAILEAEYRRSFDTYWLEDATPEFKLQKQTWITYTCQDPGGINFAMYLDGSGTPAFTFNLPQSNNRTTVRVRFPAMLYRLRRLVGTTTTGDFQIYAESELETKVITAQKSYSRVRLLAGGA